MATTHVVALFLPYTVDFHDADTPPQERQPSPPPRMPPKNQSMFDLPTRSSVLDLKGHASNTSLFRTQSPPRTPGVSDALALQVGTGSQRLHFATPGNPRSLVRNDADVPGWGSQAIFNQPLSRAGPHPSGSILDFAKVHEELSKEKLRDSTRRTQKKTSPTSRASRTASSDRGFVDKTFTVEPAIQGNSGLSNACRETREPECTEITWIGTVGFPTDALPDSAKDDIHDRLLHEYQADPVFVSDKDFNAHYSHFCKTILWPVFHYQIPDHPKSKAFLDHSWGFYQRVNQAFANKIVANYKRGDVIWIHDYHLLLVPGIVRHKLPEAQIGFFLHTAFPSSEIFRCLAKRKELLEGILGANLVAFQIDEYVQHFLQTCSHLLMVEVTAEGVQLKSRFVNVTHEPIGINPSLLHEARQHQDVQEWIELLKETYKGKKLMVARDKLDSVRGVRQKLLAYELFLNTYPEWREKVVLIQVATSTNQQSELLTTVSDICLRIAARHSTLAHSPLIFLKQDIEFSQYLALLSVADVLIVSSLRDGMNLTAHEYIFCQDGVGNGMKHGPLVLSEFTGSAAVLDKGHLSINPWNYRKQAEEFKQALEMSSEDKFRRWQNLHDIVLTRTGGNWWTRLTLALARVHEEQQQRDSTTIPRLSPTQLVEKYNASTRRIFVIDYEGTLAPHKSSSGIPLSSPQRVLDALNDLLNDGKNVVYVMSGRKPEELETIFRTVPTLGLIAENGCFLREFGGKSNEWVVFVDMDEVDRWMKDVKSILQHYQQRLEGSIIEERHCSLIFRYDKVEDQALASRQASEAVNHINDACSKLRIRAVPIAKAILIEHVDYSKRSAATHILDELHAKTLADGLPGPDFLMVAGDDREDEVVFRWANELGKNGTIKEVTTVSVGHRNTEAQSTLTQGTTGLLTVLQRLARISAESLPVDYFRRTSRA